MNDKQIEYAVIDQIGTSDFRVLATVPVLWSGWELDHDVALVELPDGRRELVTLGATRRLDRAALLRRIEAYKAAIASTEALIRVLDGEETT